ncbi:MAG: IS21 family transposase, partial [Ignavibacteriales bacterium]
MIGVDEYDRIRYLFAVEGMSRREIARRLGVSRNTVKKYCKGGCLPGERKPAQRECRITGPVRDIVSGWLREDESAPRKQRHTARRVYDRLRKEYGFQGGQSTVRRLVREMRPKEKAYIPLEFDPGEAAQVDWGEATVVIAGEKRKAHIFCMRLCYSGAAFVTAFPNERTEAFLEGHKQAFEFLGGVTRRLMPEYVPRNIFGLLFPAALCAGGPRQTAEPHLRGPAIPRVGHITITATRANS